MTLVIPHRQLREEVDEVLRWEHHRGIQWNHKAGPQCQVQICCQLLHTHTDWWWGIWSTLAGSEVCLFFSGRVLPCWSHGGYMRDLLVWNEGVGHWWWPCCQKSPPPPPPVADSMAGSLLCLQLMCWTASHRDTASRENKAKSSREKKIKYLEIKV